MRFSINIPNFGDFADVERGWFDIGLTDDEVLFSLSTSSVTALELGVPLAEAREAMN